MRFHLNAEQVAIQDAVRGTLAAHWPIEKLHQFADDGRDYDAASWRAMMDLGAASLLVPEQHGGAGMTLLDGALLCEEAGKAAAAGPLLAQILAALALSWSDQAEHQALLADVASGAKLVSLLQDGGLAQAAQSASYFLSFADAVVLYPAAEKPADAPAALSTDRSRPVGRANIAPDAPMMLFAADDPRSQRLADAALILIAADCLGIAAYCTDLSVAYAKEREQFGQPIGRFQGLKHQLAHMALDVEPARAMLWYAAYSWDQNLADSSRTAALTKAHLSDIAVRTARAAIAAHGGIGYTWEYGLNYWFRRSAANHHWMGSPAMLRARAADLAGW